MSTKKKVDYMACARRHFNDAGILRRAGSSKANAGQLFGFAVECGLKALLVKSNAPTDSDGNITGELREHLPKLGQMVTAMSTLPDGRSASALFAAVPNLNKMHDWRVDHRYWRASELPHNSLPKWEAAAGEMVRHLDDVNQGSL